MPRNGTIKDNKILRTDGKLYDVVRLRKNDIAKPFLVHRWVTKRENENHAMLKGLKAFGERHGMSKLNEGQIKIIKEALNKGFEGKQIAHYFKVSKGLISHIKIGKLWSWV